MTLPEALSSLQWKSETPTEPGWYWVRWPDGRKTLWSFDTTDDFDAKYLENKQVVAFYGPLEPPEDDE